MSTDIQKALRDLAANAAEHARWMDDIRRTAASLANACEDGIPSEDDLYALKNAVDISDSPEVRHMHRMVVKAVAEKGAQQ